jgi:hypothetical protein
VAISGEKMRGPSDGNDRSETPGARSTHVFKVPELHREAYRHLWRAQPSRRRVGKTYPATSPTVNSSEPTVRRFAWPSTTRS